jgi:iron-sulfur cluster repair protein YtfE (RIC family)
LISQHEALRTMMTRCEELADELDAGGDSPHRLMREVAKLRLAFEAHNTFEEQLLRPALLESDVYATTRIERMVEDHVGEHRLVRQQLSSPVTSELRDTFETLRAHLDAEERYLLSARVLRDNLATAART